jgi:MFS family permease
VTRDSRIRLSTLGTPLVAPAARGLVADLPAGLSACGHPAADRVLARPGWAVLGVLLTAPVLAVLDGFVTVIALPSIQRQLHATVAGAQLVVAGYGVTYAALLITAARLGDVHGRRRLLVLGLSLFSAASLGAAAAPNQEVLVVARVLQGAAAALMYPQTMALIRLHYRGRELAQAMAAFGAALGLAAVAAQLVGGVLLQADVLGLGWRSIFLVNVPIGAVASGLALLWIPEARPDMAERSDPVGVALITIGLLSFVFPLVVGRELSWPLWTWPLLASGGLAGALLVIHVRRRAAHGLPPVVDPDLFGVEAVLVGLVMTLALYAGQLSFWVLLTWYMQDCLGLSPLTTGLLFAAVAAGFLVASVTSPGLVDRLHKHVLTLGALALAVSTGTLALFAAVGGAVRPLATLPVLFACGLGYGWVIPTLVAVVLRAVPPGQAAATSGLLVTAQQVAGAVGVALSGLLFFGLLQYAVPYATAFAIALGLDVGLFLIAAVLVQLLGDSR